MSDLQVPENNVIKSKAMEKEQTFMVLPDGKVVREDVFPCLSRGSKLYRLVLTPGEIVLMSQPNGDIQKDAKMERYSIKDMFGCHTLRHKQPGPTYVSAYLCFYLYPRKRRVLLSKTKPRAKMPLVFEIRKGGNSYQENLAIATKWKEDALRLLQLKYPKWNAHGNGGQVESSGETVGQDATGDEFPIPVDRKGSKELVKLSLCSSLQYWKRYLVIVNPISGKGKGISVLEEKVRPVLLEAGVKLDLLITEYAGHAKEVVSTESLSYADGILTVGGDGLLYEVVNGLRSRPDSHKFTSIPVGAIASGSGNGLARSIAHYSGEDADYLSNPVLTTTLAAAHGKVIPVNLVEVTIDGNKSYSFLSMGWGLMSDIDVESEVLRAIGEPRFTLWGLLRLAKLRSYPSQLTYVPCENITSNGHYSSPKKHTREPVTVKGDFISVYSSYQSFIGTDMIFAPDAKPHDGLIHLTYVTKDGGRSAAAQFLLGIEKGSHLNATGVTYSTVQEFTLSSPGGFQGTVTVDGEKIHGEEIRVKISPNPLYVFAL